MTASKITPVPDGPLIVASPPDLSSAKGPVETGERAALCRCGASRTKPFCDGSHKAAGFSSAPDAEHPRNRAIAYRAELEGVEVTVSYTPMLCSHAAECQRLAGAVFNPKAKPWCQPEHGTLDSLRAVVAACPSGALRLGENAPATHLDPPPDLTSITVVPHGPYAVTNIDLDAEFNGAGASEAKYVLCRCGHSKNKPFCDGTHYDVTWRDDAEETA